MESAGTEFGSARLVIGGESAGAHLAALVLLRLRDRHDIDVADVFAGANFVFGAFDLGMTPSQRNWGDRNLVLSTPILASLYSSFLPGVLPEERRNGEISPLWADLHDLPTALFSVGDLDPLLDDSLFMHARWQAAGTRSTLSIYPESAHGFTAFPGPIAERSISEQFTFVRDVLSAR